MKNPLFTDSHPVSVLLFFLFTVTVSFVFLMIAGIVAAIPSFGANTGNFSDMLNVNNPENVNFLKYFQFIQHLGLFVLPPFIAAYIFSKHPAEYLSMKTKSPIILYVIAGLIVIFAVPLINFTGALNAELKLPESLSGIENKIKSMEESAKKMTELFLNVKTTGGLVVNVLLIALLPAVGEELVFRGVLLKIFKDWTKNKHTAIFITAFLFSAVHFQFYGFLPRFILGVLFGYMFVLSKNIFIPVFMHFINNATAVIFYFYLNGTETYSKAESIGTEGGLSAGLIFSTVILAVLIYFFVKISAESFRKQ